MSEEKSNLEEELTFSPGLVWEGLDLEKINTINSFNEKYRSFMSESKTEREVITNVTDILEKNGFVDISEIKELKPGSKIYKINKNKNMAFAVIGRENLIKGCNIIASHIDSPRLDLKARPLYEDNDAKMAVMKTHYYGGIKKYHWVNTPLAIHGKVVKEDGESIELCIGEDSDDPVFIVSDLLPHLSKKQQGDRKMKDVIKGEELNVLMGGIPIDDDDIKEKIKINILKILNDRYGMVEEDFVSAEIELVPAGSARDVGLDRSMLGAYGHDDRVCGYTSMMAAVDIDTPSRTGVVVLYDKEEIGSVGNTGASSLFLESFISDLLDKSDGECGIIDLQNILESSMAISGDVSAGVNPSFKGVHEMMNAAKLGCGIVLTKFTGAGGKFSGNDAHAEYISFMRRLFNEKDIKWQPCEIGKVDEGGGGTVARFIADMNVEIVDMGPPVLGMHSPFEIISKADVYETYRAYKTFLESQLI